MAKYSIVIIIAVNCKIHYITPIGIAALQLEPLQNEYAFMPQI
jgi:hypothetical protein